MCARLYRLTTSLDLIYEIPNPAPLADEVRFSPDEGLLAVMAGYGLGGTGGQEPDRSSAAWLNAKGARTARARAFGKDTVRGQLDRLRDLYVLGDLTKNQYVLKRQALQEELERTSPPLDPHLDQAEALLSDFARFWETEPSSAERRKLLASLFDRIWQDSGVIVAVKPRPPFVRYFKTAERRNRQRKHRRG
jgi:hypothetical protein